MSINHAENEQLHDKYTRFYDNGKHRITALSLTNKGTITNAEVTFSHDVLNFPVLNFPVFKFPRKIP